MNSDLIGQLLALQTCSLRKLLCSFYLRKLIVGKFTCSVTTSNMSAMIKRIGFLPSFRQNIRCMSALPEPNRKPNIPETKV